MRLENMSNNKLREIERNVEKLSKKVEKLQRNLFQSKFIDNADFIQIMQISSSTAKNWRNKGIIPYSQIQNKIYYQIEDIQNVLNQHYRVFKSTNKSLKK